jgi:hypothetical protein
MNSNNKYHHDYLKTLKRTQLSDLCKKYIIQTKITQANKKKEHLIQSLLLHTELDINGNIKTKQWSIMSNQKPQIIATVKQPAKIIAKTTETKKLKKIYISRSCL